MPKPSQESLIEMVREATTDVFSTMLNMSVNCEGAYVDSKSVPSNGIVSQIGIAGAWSGTGSVTVRPEFACKLCGVLMMAEYPAVDDDVLDAVAEITNMIIGNVKTQLENQLGPMGLSIPTVVYGRNFTSRNAGKHEWIVIPFSCGEERMEVQLCLAPQRA